IPYALDGLQDRGDFFVAPGTPVYSGMIVGENNRAGDLTCNVCRAKKLTNMRAAGRDDNVKLPPPLDMSLEELLEYVEDNELLEVTPTNLRLRKNVLTEVGRRKEARRLKV
ncbi:MAG: translational GTPase TypA, partial [Planctomycetota bacterium]|nr:translational GTPase TypA [Planctomycetota bacterium]